MQALSIECNEIQGHPDALLVVIMGSIEPKTVPYLKTRLDGLIKGGIRHLLVDAEGLAYINSSGLAYLVNVADQVGGLGGKVSLAGLVPSVKVIFKMMGLQDTFPMYESFADALMALSSAAEAVPVAAARKTGASDSADRSSEEVVVNSESGPLLQADESAEETVVEERPQSPEAAVFEMPSESNGREEVPPPPEARPAGLVGSILRFLRRLFGGKPASSRS